MATMNFTKQAVAKLPSPSDVPQAYYWDEDTKGLGVVVGKTGLKTSSSTAVSPARRANA